MGRHRCTELLEVIHIDIYGPFTPPAMGGYKYFITFIGDYSRYGFVELIHKKFDSLEAFVKTGLYIYIYTHTQINNTITKGLLANPRQRHQKLVTDQTV